MALLLLLIHVDCMCRQDSTKIMHSVLVFEQGAIIYVTDDFPEHNGGKLKTLI